MPELAGKVAIVTGASRGIGAAAARALAQAGASVMLAARSQNQAEANAQAINAAGGKALALECDVSDYTACQRLVDETTQHLGPARHPGQQRGCDRADQHGRDSRSRRMGTEHRDQPDRRLLRDPRRAARHAGTWSRADHKRLLWRRYPPAGGLERILFRQGWAGDADARHRPGTPRQAAFVCSASNPEPRIPTCR